MVTATPQTVALLVPRDLEDLRVALLRQAHLFDDPSAYRAGVEDALRGVLVQGTSQEHAGPAGAPTPA